jgi:transcriptional regulator with XRE-family HTH domain
MDIRKLFGANVRHFRLAAGLSQEAVAERMGVDRAYVSMIERGGQNATLLSIHETAQALRVKPGCRARPVWPVSRRPSGGRVTRSG